MRTYRALTLLAFGMAVAAGLLFWKAGREAKSSASEIAKEVSQIKRDFIKQIPPAFSLPIGALMRERVSKELVDPQLLLPQSHLFPFAEISSLASYAESCGNSGAVQVRGDALKKALLWQRFICGDLKDLPPSFFTAKPYMHPAGVSYVSLAKHSGKEEFSGVQWLKGNAPRLHLAEALREFSGVELKTSGLETQRILRGDDLVFAAGSVLLAGDRNSESNPETYFVALRSDWDRFIAGQATIAAEKTPGLNCLLEEGDVCWLQNPGTGVWRTRVIASLLLGAFLILAATLGAGGWKRAVLARAESERRLFTLQMLTHELRTPATSLRLSTETLRSQFDLLPNESQQAFLRICEELQRLDRIIDASKDYLRSEVSGALLDTSASEPVTANQLLSMILENYSGRVTFSPLAQDRSLRLKRYWIEICVKNLVENALAHGKAPVRVALSSQAGELTIAVEDQGRVAFASLDDMVVPFKKGQASHGLGLGLAIVKTVVQSMNGELHFRSQPTAFYITLKGLT